MEGVEAPSYFLCPISLQLMRDPVTLSTGITYDRDAIERWIFSGNHDTCPVTKTAVPDCELIPNHTLRRLIQAWCVTNSSKGVERFPTPRPPVDRAQIINLLDEAELPESRAISLQKLKIIVAESDRNRRCVESSGAVDVLASIIVDEEQSQSQSPITSACDDALSILYSLNISGSSLRHLLSRSHRFIECLTSILRTPNLQSRAYATLLLKSLLSSVTPDRYLILREELFVEVVRVLRDRISHQATRAALKILFLLCPWGRNRVKAVEAGAAPVLIELLLEDPERRPCEMMLVVLDQLCGCAEGRAEVVGHAAGIAVVSKNMVRVSQVATERAVRILHSVSRFAATPAVLHEMLQLGVVAKLCVLLQVDCGMRVKEIVKEMLGLHSRVWRNSPCISPQLRASYPSKI